MSKFGGFLGGNKGGQGSRSTALTTTGHGGAVANTTTTGGAVQPGTVLNLARYTQAGLSAPTVVTTNTEGYFALVVDGTASMDQLIRRVLRSLAEIGERLNAGARGAKLRFRVYVYRDYDVGRQRQLEVSPVVTNVVELRDWLMNVRTVGGDDEPEAMELALEAILAEGGFGAVLVAGDARSNTAHEISRKAGGVQHLTAQEIASRLGQAKVPVHTFVVGGDSDTLADFATIAQLSGGVSGQLDIADTSMVDMAVAAMLAKIGGRASLNDYIARYRGVMSPKAIAFAHELLRITKQS